MYSVSKKNSLLKVGEGSRVNRSKSLNTRWGSICLYCHLLAYDWSLLKILRWVGQEDDWKMFHLFAIDLDVGHIVLEDGGHVDLGELILAEDDEEAGLSTSTITNNHQLFPDGSHFILFSQLKKKNESSKFNKMATYNSWEKPVSFVVQEKTLKIFNGRKNTFFKKNLSFFVTLIRISAFETKKNPYVEREGWRLEKIKAERGKRKATSAFTAIFPKAHLRFDGKLGMLSAAASKSLQ